MTHLVLKSQLTKLALQASDNCPNGTTDAFIDGLAKEAELFLQEERAAHQRVLKRAAYSLAKTAAEQHIPADSPELSALLEKVSQMESPNELLELMEKSSAEFLDTVTSQLTAEGFDAAFIEGLNKQAQEEFEKLAAPGWLGAIGRAINGEAKAVPGIIERAGAFRKAGDTQGLLNLAHETRTGVAPGRNIAPHEHVNSLFSNSAEHMPFGTADEAAFGAVHPEHLHDEIVNTFNSRGKYGGEEWQAMEGAQEAQRAHHLQNINKADLGEVQGHINQYGTAMQQGVSQPTAQEALKNNVAAWQQKRLGRVTKGQLPTITNSGMDAVVGDAMGGMSDITKANNTDSALRQVMAHNGKYDVTAGMAAKVDHPNWKPIPVHEQATAGFNGVRKIPGAPQNFPIRGHFAANVAGAAMTGLGSMAGPVGTVAGLGASALLYNPIQKVVGRYGLLKPLLVGGAAAGGTALAGGLYAGNKIIGQGSGVDQTGMATDRNRLVPFANNSFTGTVGGALLGAMIAREMGIDGWPGMLMPLVGGYLGHQHFPKLMNQWKDPDGYGANSVPTINQNFNQQYQQQRGF